MIELYTLSDPRDGSVRYIGKAVNAKKRLASHLREHRRKTPVYQWIAEMGSAGLFPVMTVIEVCDVSVWPERERALIAEARASGTPLLNIANGGNEPLCPIEVRRANGAAVAKSRHKWIMRAYRLMEYHVRTGKRLWPDRVGKNIAAHELFKETVAICRRNGSLNVLDESLKKMFERMGRSTTLPWSQKSVSA